MITFTIPGKPVGKGRPRFYNGHAVTPEATKIYEAEVAVRARIATREKMKGAVGVEVNAYFQVPKSASKKERERLLKEPATKKPDIDNIVKTLLDGMNGVCYDDDAQVASIKATKTYVETEPFVNVKLWKLGE